jgi:hypothetical protein
MVCVDLNKMFPLVRNCRLFKDSRYRASGLTSATIDALIGVDKEMFRLFIPVLIGRRMNAIDRANIYTGRVFYTDTRLGDYIGHS